MFRLPKRLFAGTIVAGAALTLLSAVPAGAVTFYTIDSAADELITVDTETGNVEFVAALGVDLQDTDLARAGDTLYILDSHFQEFVNILVVDLASGSVLSSNPVTKDGNPLTNAEGLAFVSDQLVAAVETAGFAQSNEVGELSESGAIGSSVDYTSFDSQADFDALTAQGGSLLGLDAIPPGTIRALSAGPPAAPSYSETGRSDYVPINDVAFAAGELWGVVSQQGLVRVDPATGAVLETIAITPARSLGGLALADLTSTPTESLSWGALKIQHRSR